MKILFKFIWLSFFAIVSCTSTKPVTENSEQEEVELLVPEYTLMFVGHGPNGSWDVHLTDTNIVFSSSQDRSGYVFNSTERHAIMDAAGVTYSGQDEKGNKIRISVFKEECEVSGKEGQFAFRCVVNLIIGDQDNENVFTDSGCGEYIGDSRLDKTWYVEMFKGNSVAKTKGENGPMLKFNTEKTKVSANMGCNAMEGSYTLMENTMYFDKNFISTLMYCEGMMDLEQDFSNMISGKMISYYFKGDHLILSNREGQEILILKNIK